MLYGSTSRNPRSQFVNDIPLSLCEETNARRGYSVQIEPGKKANDFDYSNIFSAQTKSAVKKPQTPSGVSYTSGMRVEHKTFGAGFILKVIPMGNDAMLEIAFDSIGTKKIMAGYARLKILD